MLQITLPYLGGRYDVGFLLTKQNVLYLAAWRYAFYIHICCSLPVLLLGFLQVSEIFRLKVPAQHRLLGKMYIFIVLFLSAPSGFVMALFANGGLISQIAFSILSVLWWYFTFKGYNNARAGDFERHRAFMYRSFALTLSAITLRTYVLLVPKLVFIKGNDLYLLVSWMSWVPNLLVAEMIIRSRIYSMKKQLLNRNL